MKDPFADRGVKKRTVIREHEIRIIEQKMVTLFQKIKKNFETAGTKIQKI